MLYRHLERWPYRPAKMSTSTSMVAYDRTCVCMLVIIGLLDVTATPDLKKLGLSDPLRCVMPHEMAT